METAKITKRASQIIIKTPYNADLVDEIRGIPGRAWDPKNKVWFAPAASEQQVREMIRPFFQIEDEPSYVNLKVIRVHVSGSCNGHRCGGVMIDGHDLFNPSSGYLDMQSNNDFEILDYSGGFVGEVVRSPQKMFAVEYVLKLRIRAGASFTVTGHGDYAGSYEILSNDNPVDKFIDSLSLKEL